MKADNWLCCYVQISHGVFVFAGEINLYTDGRERKKANVEAVDCVGADNDGDLLRAVAQQYKNTTARIQIKNSM